MWYYFRVMFSGTFSYYALATTWPTLFIDFVYVWEKSHDIYAHIQQ